VVSDFARDFDRVGGHINDRLWQDTGISISFFPIFCSPFFSVQLRATSRAVFRLTQQGNFSMAFFTNFGVRGHVGLLDWYTYRSQFSRSSCWQPMARPNLTLKTKVQCTIAAKYGRNIFGSRLSRCSP